MNEANTLLRRAAVQFRLYERSHRGKVPNLTDQKLIDDTLEKAEVNRKIAEDIETYLDALDRLP